MILSRHNIEDIFIYFFINTNTIYNKIFKKNGIILLKLWKNYPKIFGEYYLSNTAAIPLDDEILANKIISIFS